MTGINDIEHGLRLVSNPPKKTSHIVRNPGCSIPFFNKASLALARSEIVNSKENMVLAGETGC